MRPSIQRFHSSPRSAAPRARVASIVAAAALSHLAACGGGGTSSPGANPPVVSMTTLTGTVGNASGAPVVGATVSVSTTAGPPATTQTDTTGNFALPVPTSTLNTGTVVVVTVAKDGHKACTGTVNLSNSTVVGCNILPLAGLDEMHPAPADAVLVRLGDGEISGGAANSKLQIPAPLGIGKTIALRWPANIDLTAFQTLTVNVNVRGMQAVDCANKVTVLQGATAQTATSLGVFSATNGTLFDSDSQGAFTSYALPLPSNLLSATGGPVYVKLESGTCTLGTPADPSDDFEFVGLYAKFS